MTLGHLWAGKAYGTNIGNLFVKFEGTDAALKGTLRHNDSDVGIVVYEIAGSFDGSVLTFEGASATNIEGVVVGRINASARLQANGNLDGEWESDVGAAGTFVLFPHDRSHLGEGGFLTAQQHHTARHDFGPIVIDRDDVISLAEEVQRGFSKGRLIVTFVMGTEQSRFLDDFKALSIRAGRADLIKLFVREPDVSGLDKSITIEFGPQVNWAMCQGESEA